jgi:hypothetical protein
VQSNLVPVAWRDCHAHGQKFRFFQILCESSHFIIDDPVIGRSVLATRTMSSPARSAMAIPGQIIDQILGCGHCARLMSACGAKDLQITSLSAQVKAGILTGPAGTSSLLHADSSFPNSAGGSNSGPSSYDRTSQATGTGTRSGGQHRAQLIVEGVESRSS